MSYVDDCSGYDGVPAHDMWVDYTTDVYEDKEDYEPDYHTDSPCAAAPPQRVAPPPCRRAAVAKPSPR